MPIAQRTVGEQVLEDLERRRLDYMARDFGLQTAQVDAYGNWLASLAPWTHFFTLTHDPRRLGAATLSPRRDPRARARPEVRPRLVGRQRHRRMLSRWLFDDVRRLDPSAQWFSEMEFQKSGQAHEHGVARLSENAAVLSMRQAWFDLAGYCDVRPIGGADDMARVSRSIYVAKYTGKATAVEPFIVGFGLHRRPSHSLVLGGVQ